MAEFAKRWLREGTEVRERPAPKAVVRCRDCGRRLPVRVRQLSPCLCGCDVGVELQPWQSRLLDRIAAWDWRREWRGTLDELVRELEGRDRTEAALLWHLHVTWRSREPSPLREGWGPPPKPISWDRPTGGLYG